MLNDSNVEFMSLKDLQVACTKLDTFGLNNETNEIIVVDTSGERSIITETKVIIDKLRLRVNVSIPVVSDKSFGNYVCDTTCVLQKQKSKHRSMTYRPISGYRQRKYFSVVFEDWRIENLAYRQRYYYCFKKYTDLSKTCVEQLEEVSRRQFEAFEDIADLHFKKTKEYDTVEISQKINDWLFEVYLDLALREVLICAMRNVVVDVWRVIYYGHNICDT